LFSSTAVSGQIARINSLIFDDFPLVLQQIQQRVEDLGCQCHRIAVTQEQALVRIDVELAELVMVWLLDSHA